MRKNYLDLSNKSLTPITQLRNIVDRLFLFLGLLLLSFNSYGQCNVEIPTPFVTANFDNLSVSTNTTGVCTSLLGCGITNESRLINTSLTDFATASFGISVGTTHSLRVTDSNTTYAAGTFAGFKIAPSGGLLSLDLLNGITIKTYNDGALKETFSGASLLGLSVLSSSTDYIVGFNTSMAFDAIEITLTSGISVLNSINIYHAVIREYCAGPALVCNTVTKVSLPTYPVAIDQANTGISGVSVGSVSNVENAVSSSNSDYATIDLTVGLLASGTIAIKDQVTDYPAGTYAGVEIENTNLLSLSALGNVVVATYLNGVFKEQFSGNNLVANASLLASGGRFKLGFVSTQAFDEVKLSVNQTVGLSLGTTRVYGAVFEKFCAGPTLACNTQTAITAPSYPVYVNNVNSGINGLVCALCSVVNQDNLIDTDLTNYAEVNLSVGVGTTGSLSVKEQITDYPAGTFAGYTIENPALLTVGAFDAVTVTTYLNGVQQETKTGSGALVAVGTDLLVGTGKQTVGFVSTLPFDEVKITLQNLASVNLGIVKVYHAVFQKLCDPVVECNKNYLWTNPDFPVTIDGEKSGIDGVACVSCAVTDTANLLTASKTDFANITLIAGVIGSGSVAVKDHLFTYPKGTFAGYVIKDLGTLAQVNLLQSLTISTYNNGVLQEARTAGQLIDLSAVGIDVLGSVPGTYNVGFSANLPFDEIRLTLNSVASVVNSINVYGAFVDTSDSDDGGSGSLACNSSSVSVTKDGTYVDANSDGKVNVGDRVDYTFTIKNTGNETLTNVSLTDSNANVSGTPIASLAPGASNTTAYTASHTITQADIDAGVVYNLATVTATTPFGPTITATSTDPTPCATCPVNPACTNCTATPITQTNTIALVKTAVVGGTGVLGDVITYTFSITNTGNTTLNNVTVTDPMTGLVISGSPIASLAPGATNSSIKGTYVISQADVDAGKVTNSALVTAKDPQNNNVTDTSGTTTATDDSTITPVTQTNTIALVKTGSVSGAGGLGDTITYTFAVTNTGTTTLTNVTVTDPMVGLIITGNPIASLAPGATNLSITGTYVITQAEVNAGKVTNSALVTAKDPQNNDVTDVSGTTITTDDSTETPIGSRSTIALVKTGVVGGTGGLGATITYTFAVTNTGTTTLTNVVVSDPMTGLTITGNPIVSLAPGVTDTSITGTYVITQADVDAGKVTNSALVTAKDPVNNDVTDISGTTIGTNNSTETPVTQTNTIALVKTAVVGGTGALGDTITYTFAVKNTGTTTLKNIVISDPMVGLNISANLIATLAPGVTDTSITGTYVITQADVDTGKVTNSALVTAKSPQNTNVTDISGTTETTNDNTVATVSQTNTIALVKTAVYNGNATKAAVGDTITYTFAVTNTGTTTLHNIAVTDPMTGLVITGSPVASLAPGVSNSSITGTYVITQADINAGKVTNSALVTALNPQGLNVQDTSGTAVNNDTSTETTLPKSASLAFVKTAVYSGNATKAAVGDKITYTFTVTNTGNVTVSNILINDAKLGASNLALVPATLVPAAIGVVTKDYFVTQADIDAGKVTNTAIAKGQDPQGIDVQDVSGTAVNNDTSTETTLPKSASLAFVKTAVYNGNATKAAVGDKITYTFTVTNTGNVTVSNILVNDAKLGATNLALIPATLAPLAIGVVTKDYFVTQADIDAGKVTNTAIAKGQDPQGIDVQDISGTTISNDTSTETTLPKSASLAFVKTAAYNGNATKATVGDKITYTFTVTNTGNVTVSNILINDAKLGATNLALVPATLAPLAIGVITKDYFITQADIDAGKVTNTAIAKGQDPQGVDVQDISGTTVSNDTSTETILPKSASLAFVKTAVYSGNATKATVGDKITYTFTVTNTGNVTVTNILINDAKLGATNLALVPATLAPLGIGVVTKDYFVTQADIDAGKVTNTAIAKGQDPQGIDVQDVSGTAVNNDTSTETTLPKSASLAFVKTAVYSGNATKAAVGDKITYTFTVTNTGNVTVSNILINDAKLGASNLALVPATLAPAAIGVVTKDYFVTQTDIDAGKVTNTAIAKGQDPQGVDVQDISGTTISNDTSTETTLPKSASLAFVKTAAYNGNATKAAVGDKITYTFTVTNTGNVTVSNILINDAKLGATNLALIPATLAPLAIGVVTKDYFVTQADIDAGKVTNTAIAKGQDPQGIDVQDVSGTAVNNDTSTETTLPKSASLAFVKTAVYSGNATKAVVGDKITYTFTVTNTGNVTVSNILINDAKLGTTNLALVPATLAPLGIGVVTKDYFVTQADIDAGKVTNTAIAKGKDPQGIDVQDVSGTAVNNDTSTETTLPKSASLAFVKTAVYSGNATKATVGDKITYTFTVTNTGNVTVSNIVINDAKLGASNLALVPATLAPLGIGVVTKDYFVTQADIDAGKVTNTAIAKGKDPQGIDVQDISGTAVNNDTNTVTNLPQDFKIALVKTAVVSGSVSVGGTVTYTFAVTNTGNGTINNIVVSDPMVGLTIPVSTIATLAPGTTNNSIVGTYILKQSDVDAGQIVNSALAVGKDPQGNNVQDVSGTAITNDTPTITALLPSPSISVTKDGTYVDTNNDGITSVGDRINYSFVVRNTGNTSLSNVMITDVKATITGAAIPTLAYNTSNSTAFTGVYIITQADITAGVVYNLATVEGTSPKGIKVTNTSTDPTPCISCPVNPACPTCTITSLTQSPKIALLLDGEFQDENQDGQAQIGETIKYTYTIMNTGNVPLSNVWIDNAMVGLNMNSGTINMSIGAMDNTTFTASYSITQADIIAGHVTNQAKVYGTSPLGVIVEDLSDKDNPLENDATVIGIDGCVIKVFNAVSPNIGSDYERILYIRGIDCYPNNTVQIFDRWGVKVYEVDGYDNGNKAFRGVSEGRTTLSQSNGLPSGTYFYVLKYVDAEGKGLNQSGYLHLVND